MKKITLISLMLTGCLLAPLSSARADIVAVVAHPSIQNNLTADQVRRIYMGKMTMLPDGSKATPLLVKQADQTLTAFARTVLKRSTKQLKSYWAKRLFTGKSTPPVSVSSFAEMKSLVANNPGYIGYILLSETDDTVKTVYVANES